MYLAAAARLARQRIPTLHRSIATTVSSSSAPSTSSSSSAVTPVALSNVEASWTKLSPEEKVSVHQQLEQIQKKDWKELSIDEKKAGQSLFCFGHSPDRRKSEGVSVHACSPYFCFISFIFGICCR